MSPIRENLSILEASGQYVFHGSGEELDVLEPQQAHNRVNGERVEDGPPAVFATPIVDYAVFMAVFSKRNCPLGRRTSVSTTADKEGYEIRLRATPATISQVTDASSGWVYVFEKSQFFRREEGGVEYTVRQPVKPLKKVRVTRADLVHPVEEMPAGR